MGEQREAVVHESGIQTVRLAGVAAAGVRARWTVSLLLLLAVTVAFFDRIDIAVLFTNQEFKSDLGVSDPALLGLLMTAFVLPYGASMFLLSVLGDVFGPRKTLTTIAGILAATAVVMGSVSSYAVMLGARAVLGVAEAPQFGTATVAVKRWFPPREQGVANALWTIGSPLGSALGFPLVLFIVTQYGWRASFYALAGLNALVVLPTLWFFLKDSPAEAAPRPEDRMPFREAIGMLAGNWRFWLLPIYNSGGLIFLWGFNAWLPTYLQKARHFDIAHTGLYSSLPFVLMIVGEFGAAWIGDRTGKRALVCFVSLFMTGVFLWFAALAPGAELAAWCLAFSAGFWGGTTPTLFSLGMQIIPRRITGMGLGIYAGIANFVGSLAPYIMGLLIGREGDYNAGLYFLVFCCIGLSFFMLPLARRY
jgi:sugar phosphate permease